MKRHIAWLLSCGLLVGCGAAPPPIDAPSAPTPAPNQNNSDHAPSSSSPVDAAYAPAAFNFKSGVLEIGDFDPYTLGDNIFDPCTEISPEEFAAAGFDNVEPLPEEYAGLAKGLSACTIDGGNAQFAMSFSNSEADKSMVLMEREVPETPRSAMLPTLFIYGTGRPEDADCYAQVDTHRGGIVSSVSGFQGQITFEDTCKLAISNLEDLFRAHGN